MFVKYECFLKKEKPKIIKYYLVFWKSHGNLWNYIFVQMVINYNNQ